MGIVSLKTRNAPKMKRNVNVFLISAVFISLVQTLDAITKKEYDEKSNIIKRKDEVQEFLQNYKFVISQYGVFFYKLANDFSHVVRTKPGNEALQSIWTDTEIILRDERAHDVVRKIFVAFKKVLTSETGTKNVLTIMDYVHTVLTVPDGFEAFASLTKILIDLLIAPDGLEALKKKEDWYFKNVINSPIYRPLMEIVEKEFPIFFPQF